MPIRVRRAVDLPKLATVLPLCLQVSRLLDDCGTILDVGCGTNSPLQYVRGRGVLTGLDADQNSIEISRRKGLHDQYILGNALQLDLPEKSYDAVVAMEILEHLPKEKGKAFLSSLERLAKQIVVVTTPNGFVPQEPVDGNEFQRHVSGYSAQELRDLGYTVRGFNGLKELRGEWAEISRKPHFFWRVVSALSEPFVQNRPERAFGLLAFKRL